MAALKPVNIVNSVLNWRKAYLRYLRFDNNQMETENVAQKGADDILEYRTRILKERREKVRSHGAELFLCRACPATPPCLRPLSCTLTPETAGLCSASNVFLRIIQKTVDYNVSSNMIMEHQTSKPRL